MQWAATTWHDMYCLFNSQHKARNQILMGSQLKICLMCAKKGADDKKRSKHKPQVGQLLLKTLCSLNSVADARALCGNE